MTALYSVFIGFNKVLAMTSFLSKAVFFKFTIIAGAALLIMKNWAPIKDFFSELWDAPMQKLNDFLGMIQNLGAIGAIKTLFGFDAQDKTDKDLLAKGFSIQKPGGEALGAKSVTDKVNSDFTTRTNNARVNVNFSNLPEGAKVVSSSENDILKINNGLAGAF
jgi:hypothetical protein